MWAMPKWRILDGQEKRHWVSNPGITHEHVAANWFVRKANLREGAYDCRLADDREARSGGAGTDCILLKGAVFLEILLWVRKTVISSSDCERPGRI